MLAKMEVLLEELEPLARIRWSPVSQLHITTKFIGDWPFNRIPEMVRYLDGNPRLPRFTVTAKGLLYRRNPDKSWVLFARVEPCEGLLRLAGSMDEQLRIFGFQPEWEEYRPHITIGRIAGSNPWPLLDQKVDEYAELPFGSFEATEYHLYESTPSGYRQFASIPLVDGSSTL